MINLLLDTHVFIWWSISPKSLSSQVEKLIANTDNALFLSLASIWEMQIKIQLGKLDLDVGLSELVQKQQEVNSLNLLPIEVNHIYALK
jgi:PIN domain nuclease of toxin-antitoxin system